jgi:hypothetical protein
VARFRGDDQLGGDILTFLNSLLSLGRSIIPNIPIFYVYFLIQSEKNTLSETSIMSRITSGKVIRLMRNTVTGAYLLFAYGVPVFLFR